MYVEKYLQTYNKLRNYSNPLEIKSIDVSNLTQSLFHKEYLEKNKPCVVENTTSDWDALKKWDDKDYLKSILDIKKEVRVRIAPDVENHGTHIKYHPKKYYEFQENEDNILYMPLGKFFEEAFIDSPNHFTLYSLPIAPDSLLAPLANDLSEFDFVNIKTSLSFYQRYMAFLCRSTFTDWHYHPGAEAIMSQIVGTKEVLLLSPSKKNWDILMSVIQKYLFTYEVDIKNLPEFQDLELYKVLMKPGDSLYIPVNWWHLVTSNDHHFGATFVHWFDPPANRMFDPASPCSRRFMLIRFKQLGFKSLFINIKFLIKGSLFYLRKIFFGAP